MVRNFGIRNNYPIYEIEKKPELTSCLILADQYNYISLRL